MTADVSADCADAFHLACDYYDTDCRCACHDLERIDELERRGK
jgi:hypothetical protein